MGTPVNATLYRYTMFLTNKFAEGIEEEHMRMQPAAGMNPPIWILGHLACIQDIAMKLAKADGPECPPEWKKAFMPGTRIDAIPSNVATKKQLMDKLNQGGELIMAALTKLTDADYKKPHGLPVMATELPLMGDLLNHLLFTHHQLHMGQLTVWRRLMGLPSVVK